MLVNDDGSRGSASEVFLVFLDIRYRSRDPSGRGATPPAGLFILRNPHLTHELSSVIRRTLSQMRGDACGWRFAGDLQWLAAGTLDCAILPFPIDLKTLDVIPVANSQLVVCMRTDDALASQSTLDIHEIAPRISVFRDPELHPGAHARFQRSRRTPRMHVWIRSRFCQSRLSIFHVSSSIERRAQLEFEGRTGDGLLRG